MYRIELIDKRDIYTIIPLLRILNERIEIETLQSRLNEMVEKGYECAGVFDGERLIGICGIWILTKYYVGRHIEPDNVIIHPDYRNTGVGEMLLNWIYEYGRSKGCVAAELNCYVKNNKGHKFWFKEGFQILGFHYQKQL